MIDFDYLYKGICGLANAHRAGTMAGHLRHRPGQCLREPAYTGGASGTQFFMKSRTTH